jgi:hypothetical protein
MNEFSNNNNYSNESFECYPANNQRFNLINNTNNSSYNNAFNYSVNQNTMPPPPHIKKVIKQINEVTTFNDSNNINNNNNNNKQKMYILEQQNLINNNNNRSLSGSSHLHNSHIRNKSASNFHTSQTNFLLNNRSNPHNLSSSSLPPPQQRVVNLQLMNNNNESASLFNQPVININKSDTNSSNSFRQIIDARQNCTNNNNDAQFMTTRRSYSSCGEPKSLMYNGRRCMSNRASPVRPIINSTFCNNNNALRSSSFRSIHDSSSEHHHHHQQQHRSRSVVNTYCTPIKQIRSPSETQLFRREIKINITSQPPPPKPEFEEQFLHNISEKESRTVVHRPTPPPPPRITSNILSINQPIVVETQEEVLLNLFSCNNSGSVSSDSSESLVDLVDNSNLKINEIIHYTEEKKMPEAPKRHVVSNTLLLEKRLVELEKKLQRIPELEIKNNILLEEKQILLKQIMNMKTQQPTKIEHKPDPPSKVFRSIGCDSIEVHSRDIGIECKANTRDFGTYDKLDDRSEEIEQLHTVITKLRDQINEQNLTIIQLQTKPQTRDVAIMHVVDKVEEKTPEKEYRDVAINHTTEVDNTEIIEKHKTIVNTYIKEIEQIKIEKAQLSTSLEELIKKHSKHVITRGTHAPDIPIMYSVGTNTKRTVTRDVQLMFTPKSRDVSLCTDSVNHIRDVGLMCTIESTEQVQKMEELLEIQRRYECKLREISEKQASLRHVSTICNLDVKESRTIGLGCDLKEVIQKRDVSMKCNLDQELRVQHDVGIGCCMEKKPEKRDAYVCTNIIQHKETRSHSVTACIEDPEKVKILK